MLRRISDFFVALVHRYMVDPLIFAILLTFAAFLLALLVGNACLHNLFAFWGMGVFNLLSFAMQMVLILVTGFAVAKSRAVGLLLERVASLPKTKGQAVVVVFLGSAIASLVNWGLGLVVGAFLAKRVTRNCKGVPFGFLVATAYSGFIVWASGLSSSIPLISATPSSPMNFAEKEFGYILPLKATLLCITNVLPTLLTILLVPILFLLIMPKRDEFVEIPEEEISSEGKGALDTPAKRLENSWWVSRAFLVLILVAFVVRVSTSKSIDINTVILFMLCLGVALYPSVMEYANAISKGAALVGPMILQYPLYGGIQGVLEHSGAGSAISAWFIGFSSAQTLPFWSYVSSFLLNFFVPSGGGHWVVQGPIMMEAAKALDANPATVALAVAVGESVGNMLQPFWALPLLAIAGLGVRDIMGYCVLVFVLGFILYGSSLLLFPFG